MAGMVVEIVVSSYTGILYCSYHGWTRPWNHMEKHFQLKTEWIKEGWKYIIVWHHLDTVLKHPRQWDVLFTDIYVCDKSLKDD